ncbi:MAG TPA: methionine--tRNA ligase [Armatimonadota bacterium]
MANTFYITTPIYYVNGLPHIGTSYTSIAADVLARFHRLRGDDVLFLTGTDENAPKVAEVARLAGRDPQEFVDEMSAEFQKTWKRLNISYDQFIRTTEQRHVDLVQDIFARLRDQGDIYKGTYEGYYCIPDETFWTDTQVVMDESGQAHCPNPECRRPVQRVQEENYFFRLSAYSDRLLKAIQANPKMLAPEFRKNEVLSFIKDGLRDVSITRKGQGWGIPVPGDPDFVVYIWFDALINYLTAVGYGKDDATFNKWWPCNVQLMGKDIFVRFHCTFWPGMLMALGLPLPERLVGHGFFTVDGEKIGKSKGNAVDPHELALDLSRESGCLPDIAVDAIRYFVFREIPFGQDADFSRSALKARFNGELANDLGNLLNRTLALVDKYFQGVLPERLRAEDGMAAIVSKAAADAAAALEDIRFQEALEAIWTIVSAGNKFIDERAPWKLQKEGNTAEAGHVLYTVLDAVRSVAILIQPFMPVAAQAIWTQLGIPEELAAQSWESAAASGRLPSRIPAHSGAPIFPRIDPRRKQETMAQMDQTPAPVAAETANRPEPPASPAAEPESPRITIDDFRKVELKVARVLTAERVPKADKLLHMTIDVGEPEPRSLVAGVAQHYTPEEMVGKSIIVVANLQPAKIRGVQSNGMLLAAEADGKVILLGPLGDLPPGASVR